MNGSTSPHESDSPPGPHPDDEEAIRLVVTSFPNGTRDFVLVRLVDDHTLEAVHPLELLALDRTVRLIERLGQNCSALALNLALVRLLVPCLAYRGSGRHLMVETWTEADLEGATLPVDTRTPLAQQLARKQAEDWRMVTTGTPPPEESLAAAFWTAHTQLPWLPAQFDDPALGRFARALYFHLVEAGTGRATLETSAIQQRIRACQTTGFAALELGMAPRQAAALFRRLLAVSVRYASQLTGTVAEALIRARSGQGTDPFPNPERDLIALRYGACATLGDINVGFLFGCGPLMGSLIDEYARSLALGTDTAACAAAATRLRGYITLLARFRARRKQARAAERREDRQRHARRLPAPAQPAANEVDTSSPDPVQEAIRDEERALLEQVLPRLKPRDRRRMEALLMQGGDRRAAAAQLGVSLRTFSRQLRQTVLPAVKRAVGAGRSARGDSEPS
jgi:hypothetical protein